MEMKIIPSIEVLVGPSGVGKSTYARTRLAQFEKSGIAGIILSSDALRAEMWGDESDQRDPQKIFEEMGRRARSALKEGVWVIYDATNLSEKFRRHFLSSLEKIPCFKNCVVFAAPPSVCIERQKKRERKVPEYVVWKQVMQFQMPHYYEGWNNIQLKVELYESSEVSKVLAPLRGFDQRNPHHRETLDGHLVKAARYSQSQQYPEPVYQAALFHDIGKMFTQSFDDDGVAHYYGHEKVGAYYYLLLAGDSLWSIEVAWLITHHMDFFKGEVYLKKLKDRIPEALWEMLAALHECDMAAH